MSGGSGGYLEYVFRYAAKELFGKIVDKVEFKPMMRGRSSTDFQVTTLEVN